MAVVFRAREEALGRVVALKVLVPALAEDEEFRRRFIRESRAATAADHPHIIPVYAAGEAGGVLYIAMRYVSGGDLQSLIRREGPLSAGRAAYLLARLASALDAGHAAGLVHRDVKPGNVLIEITAARLDHPYLSDYGLAKGIASTDLTVPGQFHGTVEYCAPEQIEGRVVGPATDQYALACVAYTMLTGAVPFPREDAAAMLWAHLSDPPPCLTALRPDLPCATDQVLARAMAKTPEHRYPSCEEFVHAFRAALGIGGRGVPGRHTPGSGLVSVLASPAPRTSTRPDPTRPYPPPPVSAQSVAQRKTAQPAVLPWLAVRPRGGHHVKAIPKQRRRRVGLAVAAAVAVAMGATGSAAGLLWSHGSPERPRPVLLATLPEPDDWAPAAIAFPSDGTVVTGDMHGRAYVWNLASKRDTLTVADSNQLLSVALSPDGSTFATIDNDFNFTTWSTSGGYQTGTPDTFQNVPPGNDALSTTEVLAAAETGTPVTPVWDTIQGSQIATLTSPDHQDVLSVAVNPAGSIVATGDDSGATYLWEVATSTLLTTLPAANGKPVNCAAFSANGGKLITSYESGEIRVWDVATHALVKTLSDPTGDALSAVALSPNGTVAAAADSASNAIYLWDVASGQLIGTVAVAHSGSAASLAFSPDGTELAAGDADGSTYVWRIAS